MKYVANPVIVDAFKIESVQIVTGLGPGTFANLLLEDNRVVTVTADMMSRMSPVIGDYYVVQGDGYVYLNPKDVFERKYHVQELQEMPGAVVSRLECVFDICPHWNECQEECRHPIQAKGLDATAGG